MSSLCVVLYIRWSVALYALLREVETTAQTQVFYYAKLVSWSQVKLALLIAVLLNEKLCSNVPRKLIELIPLLSLTLTPL